MGTTEPGLVIREIGSHAEILLAGVRALLGTV